MDEDIFRCIASWLLVTVAFGAIVIVGSGFLIERDRAVVIQAVAQTWKEQKHKECYEKYWGTAKFDRELYLGCDLPVLK